MEKSKPPDEKRTCSNWLRSETIRGTEPHLFLSHASTRITGINKYQHNTKFCIFIICPLPTQINTLSNLYYQHSERSWAWAACEPALLHVQSSVESISHIVTRVTSLTCCGCNSPEALLSKMTDLLHSHAECEDCLSPIICVHLTWQSPTTEYFSLLPSPPLALLLQHVQTKSFHEKGRFSDWKWLKMLWDFWFALLVPSYNHKSQVTLTPVFWLQFSVELKACRRCLTLLMPCCDLKELNTDQTITHIPFTLFFIILMRFSTHPLNHGWRKLALTCQNPCKLLKIHAY